MSPRRPPGPPGPGGADRGAYVISVAAALVGSHPQTLRLYERRGLVAPSRTTGRSRRYSDDDLVRLRRIAELTAAGVGLAGVALVLDLERSLAQARQRIAELESQRDLPPLPPPRRPRRPR